MEMIKVSRVKNELLNIKELDIYSLILFALFKLRDIPDYLALSELVFLMDKKELLKLCEYFGGMTIQIPTIQELESMVYSLLLYQYINVENMNYEDAIKLIGSESKDLRQIKSDYQKLSTILEQYSFGRNNEK